MLREFIFVSANCSFRFLGEQQQFNRVDAVTNREQFVRSEIFYGCPQIRFKIPRGTIARECSNASFFDGAVSRVDTAFAARLFHL